MPKDEHKAAEHNEKAAKAHRSAAEHHGKGDHSKGNTPPVPSSIRRPLISIVNRPTPRASTRNNQQRARVYTGSFVIATNTNNAAERDTGRRRGASMPCKRIATCPFLNRPRCAVSQAMPDF